MSRVRFLVAAPFMRVNEVKGRPADFQSVERGVRFPLPAHRNHDIITHRELDNHLAYFTVTDSISVFCLCKNLEVPGRAGRQRCGSKPLLPKKKWPIDVVVAYRVVCPRAGVQFSHRSPKLNFNAIHCTQPGEANPCSRYTAVG